MGSAFSFPIENKKEKKMRLQLGLNTQDLGPAQAAPIRDAQTARAAAQQWLGADAGGLAITITGTDGTQRRLNENETFDPQRVATVEFLRQAGQKGIA